ncbi:MAG: SET domain-containing protein-lysine N-methyltransferase [Nitrospina sp.]|nr:MAG: SET domain-containing protein-lysine N-methyltransferase [Nitrospina sp.]
MKLKEGDSLFDPMSRNNGEVTKIINHPNGKLVTIRWRVDDHLPHDTEHFYSKIVKSIKKGEIEHTPSSEN